MLLNWLTGDPVDVANCYLHEEYTDISDQRSLARQSTFSKMVIPMKRRFNDYSSINFEYASGGNGAAIYSELDPIISRALQNGVTEIDVNMASIVEAAVHLRSTRRNPRVLLAASGAPDLSDIMDVTEPSSPLTLEPNESMADAKSPTKRDSTQSPSPTKSNKSFRKRLSDTIVRLLPVSSSRAAEPSPIKPSSPPTPSRDSPSARQRSRSLTPKSPSAARSPLSANSTPGLSRWSSKPSKDSPFARWRPKRKSEPAPRLASSPRNEPSSPVMDAASSFEPESPIRQSRPLAPTPSQWSGFHPSTPDKVPASTVATVAATPGDNEESLDLVKSLPEWMQQNAQSPAALEKAVPETIDFGPASPSFTNSVSWINSPVDTTESERTKIVRRRKSEPLFRNVLKAQTSRRISLSPQKAITSDGASGAMPTIHEPASPTAEEVSQLSDHHLSDHQVADHHQLSASPTSSSTQIHIPHDDTEQETEAAMETASSQYNRRLHALTQSSPSTPRNQSLTDDIATDNEATDSGGVTDSSRDDVFNVDMHRDQDIFGAPRPVAPAYPAVEQLAMIAEHRCNGHANVEVTKKNGRLFVRFKLPVLYASMFPESQGADDSSRFSSTPSISSSPRVKFPSPGELTLLEAEYADSWLRTADETLAVSDFDGSPVERNSASPPSEQEVANSSADDKSDDSVNFPDIRYADRENTTPDDVPSSPVKVSSDSSSLSDLAQTPSLNQSDAAATSSEEEPAAEDQGTSSLSWPPIDPVSPSWSSHFTPVNQASARRSSTSSSTRSNKSTSSAKSATSTGSKAGKQRATPSVSHNNDDTPERDFLRDFIRRARPRRLSTTETGSPIAPQQRQPLGSRSPNMETPQGEKRKHSSSSSEGEENESDTKTEPSPKRVRRIGRASPRKSVADNHSDDEEDPLSMDAPTESSDNAAEPAKKKESPALARRSSRLRTKPGPVPKSSIPAPTRVGRGRPAASTLSSLRNEQQDLVHQTRLNTRRNKGNAKYPAQFLAGHSEEEEEDEDQQDDADTSKARGGKSVIWKEPLADYQEEAKPKRGRPVSAAPKAREAKAKAKPVSTGRIAKAAPKPSASTQKQRSTRLAAGLGMAGNGTPAAKRVTRASTRTRK